MSSTQEAGEIFGEGRGPAHAMLRSPTVLIASVGLWGMNVLFFRMFKINYVKVLKHDLLKLEEMEYNEHNHPHNPHHHHHHHKDSFREDAGIVEDDSSCFNLPDNSSVDGFSSSQRPPLPQPTLSSSSAKARSSSPSSATPQLIQRQPSNGISLAAAAAAGSSTTPTSSPGSAGTDNDEDDDAAVVTDEEDPQQQLISGNSGTVMGEDHQHGAITWKRLVGLSVLLLFLLHSTYYWWLDILEGGTIGAVLMFYTFVFLAIITPFRCTRWLRKATVITLQRTYELINPRCHCVTNDGLTPPRFIPFVDVFYADAMCSLSKVFFDWGMLLHMVSHYPNPVPASTHNILIPSACAAIPYLIRARQCLIMYTVGRIQKEANRFSHLWNALKYSTSIFPLCLSAYQQTISKHAAHKLEGLLIALMVINSAYSLYWDIVMDWGMCQENPLGVAFCNTGSSKKTVMANPHKATPSPKSNCAHTVLRPQLRFGFGLSVLIFTMDCILRFSWTLRFAKKTLFPNADAFVLCTQFLEVFRRALWNLLRVEWENIKHQSKQRGGATSPTTKHNAASSVDTAPAASNLGAAVEVELKSLLPSGKLNTL